MLAVFILVAATWPAPWSDAISRYQKALAEAKRGGSVEAAFDRAAEVKKALQPPDDDAFESLSQPELERLHGELPGFLLSNFETIVTEPDAAFFLDLANAHGTTADVAFFEEFARTYRGDSLPSYLEPTYNWSACTTLGRGELLARYTGWRRYRAAHAQYRQYADEEIRKIEEEIETDCACDGRESAIGELTEFVWQFPNTPAAATAAKQLRTLRAGNSKMRFQCRPG